MEMKPPQDKNRPLADGQRQWHSTNCVYIVLISIALAMFLAIIAGGYIFDWQWTGFAGNTLWDWLKLLVLPVVLAVGGIWFNAQQNHASRQVTLQQHQTDLHIADDQQQEAVLDAYLL